MDALKINPNYDCGCKKPHGYQKKIISAGIPMAEMMAIMPQGVKALFLSENDLLKKSLSRFYPLDLTFFKHMAEGKNESIQNQPQNTGFFYPSDSALLSQSSLDKNDSTQTPPKAVSLAVKDKCATDSQLYSALKYRDFEQVLSAVSLSENIRLVISEGEYIALGKYIAQKLNIKHVICGGGNLSPYDFSAGFEAFSKIPKPCEIPDRECLFKAANSEDFSQRTLSLANGYHLQEFAEVDAVINDPENINVPSGFAYVLSCYLALFDWDISALLFGDSMCTNVFKEAQKTVSKLMDAAALFSKHSVCLKNAVLEAQLKMAELTETAGFRIILSGANQAAAALSALYRHEGRELIDFFDISFLFCPTIAKIYAAFLDKNIPFSFPPNNNFRAQRMQEYLGIEESESLKFMPNYLNIKAIEITDYRLGVYRNELLRHIYSVIKVLDAAYPVYFKLFDDDGFSLKGFISSLDSSLAVGLGCDVLRGNTLLNYIRGKGLLDRYII